MYTEKGTIGYIKQHKKRYLLITLILVGLIALSVFVIFLFKGNLKNIYAVIPVLLALPLAKCFIMWYIVAGFRPITEEEAEKIVEFCRERPNSEVLFDTALSAYEAVSYSKCTVVDQGNIYLLFAGSYSKKYKDYHQREYVQDIINKTGYAYKAYTVKSTEEMLERLASAEVSGEDLSAVCARLKQRILDVCV